MKKPIIKRKIDNELSTFSNTNQSAAAATTRIIKTPVKKIIKLNNSVEKIEGNSQKQAQVAFKLLEGFIKKPDIDATINSNNISSIHSKIGDRPILKRIRF